MRNNFEHFDERLDRWWADSKRHNVADMNIAPINMAKDFDEIDLFRFCDPDQQIVSFWGQDFFLKDLTVEIKRIMPKLEEELNKPHWL